MDSRLHSLTSRSLTRRDLLRSGLALSASTLVAGSVGRAHALLAGYPGAASAEAMSAVAPREHLLFDFGWKFFQGHASDPLRDLGFGMGQGDFAKSGELWFSTAKFDDSKWRQLNLPHDWAVELPFVHDDEQQSHGYKPLGRRYPETSVGWYRRTFDIPTARQRTPHHSGVRWRLPQRARVFEWILHWTQRQRLRALSLRRHRLPQLWRQEFSDGAHGRQLWRWLVLRGRGNLPACVADEDGCRCTWDIGTATVRTAVKGNAATLSLATVVQNRGHASRELPRALADSGCVRKSRGDGRLRSAIRCRRRVGHFHSQRFELANPALWSPETPNMYSAIVTVEVGRQGARRGARQLRRTRHPLGCRQGILPQRQIGKDQRYLQPSRSCRSGRSASRPAAVVPIGGPEGYGWQCRAHFAQHADAGVGGGLRPHGHDDDVRDAADEFQPGRHGAVGGDGEALSQLAVDHFVVDGQ